MMFKIGDKIVIKNEKKFKFNTTRDGTFKQGTDLDQVFEIRAITPDIIDPTKYFEYNNIYLTSSDCRSYLFGFEIEHAEDIQGQMRLPFKWGG